MSTAQEHRTVISVCVRVTGEPDLRDPVTKRTVIPASVWIELTRLITPAQTSEWASVNVYGPRRLKSGEPGAEISSFHWQHARNEGHSGYVDRPAWLTTLIAEYLPEGWSPSLVELSGGHR